MSLLGLAACSRSPEARADTARSDSTRCGVAGGDVVRPQEDTARRDAPVAKDSSSASPDTPRATDAVVAASGDSTAIAHDSTTEAVKPKEPAVEVRVIRGRSKKDSLALVTAVRDGGKVPGWPVKGSEPLECSIIPQNRIIAFYGNPLSKKMGVLGALPPEQMLANPETIVREWRAAEPDPPVQPGRP